MSANSVVASDVNKFVIRTNMGYLILQKEGNPTFTNNKKEATILSKRRCIGAMSEVVMWLMELSEFQDITMELLYKKLPTPTPNDLKNPIFNDIYNVIKDWDIGVPESYAGHCSGTGSHAKAILDGIRINKGIIKKPDYDKRLMDPVVEGQRILEQAFKCFMNTEVNEDGSSR